VVKPSPYPFVLFPFPVSVDYLLVGVSGSIPVGCSKMAGRPHTASRRGRFVLLYVILRRLPLVFRACAISYSASGIIIGFVVAVVSKVAGVSTAPVRNLVVVSSFRCCGLIPLECPDHRLPDLGGGGVPASMSAASSSRASLRASLSVFLTPKGSCRFMSLSRIPSANAWAVSYPIRCSSSSAWAR
jgi:hypothetical protein